MDKTWSFKTQIYEKSKISIKVDLHFPGFSILKTKITERKFSWKII